MNGDIETAVAGEVPQPATPKASSNAPSNPSDGVAAAIMSIFLPQSSRTSDTAEDPPLPSPDPPSPPHISQETITSANSIVYTAHSSQGPIVLDGSQPESGQETIISGQTISAESGTVFVNGAPKHHSVVEQSSTLQGSPQVEVAENPPLITPAPDSAPPLDHGIVIGTGSEVHTVLSSQGLIFLDGTPLNSGQGRVVSGQTISAQAGVVHVNGIPQHFSILDRPSTPQAVLTVAGQEHTAVRQSDGAVYIDGKSYIIGEVVALDAVGAMGDSGITIASKGIVAGDSVVPFAEPPFQYKQDTVLTVNGHTYSANRQSGSLPINGSPVSVGGTITIDGDVLTIGSHAIGVGGTAVALPDEHPELPAVTASANIVIAGETMTAFKDGDTVHVLVDRTKLTLGQVTTISGTRIEVASNGIVVGSSTATFHDTQSSTAEAGSAVTIDGTVYSASAIADQTDAFLLAGQTLLKDGTAATIEGQLVTNGPNGISIVDPTASATATSEANNVGSVFTIDGIAYTATPVAGNSDAVVLQGHTLSVGGPGVTFAHHVITKASSGILVTETTSSAADATSEGPSSTETLGSFTIQESSSTPTEESRASKVEYGFGGVLAMLLLAFMNL